MTVAQQLTQAATEFALADLDATGEAIGNGAQKRVAVERMELLSMRHQHAELFIGERKRF
jgi:hypothetical protein